MKEIINGYLSRKAQNTDLSALVVCLERDDGKEEWVLRRKDQPEVGLGAGFGEAKIAVIAWSRSMRTT